MKCFKMLAEILNDRFGFSYFWHLNGLDVMGMDLVRTLLLLYFFETKIGNEVTAQKMGVGNGTVVLYTRRVIKAINSLEHQFVYWPNRRLRAQMSSRLERTCGFKDCVGFVDGTHVVFMQKPSKDPETWYCYKGYYGMNLQVIFF